LPDGAELKHGYRILALLSRTSKENRYRAERVSDPSGGLVQLREQLRAAGDLITGEASTDNPLDVVAQSEADPAGPRAKTADLKLREHPPGPNGSAVPESTVALSAAASAASPGESEGTAQGSAIVVESPVEAGVAVVALTEELAEVTEPAPGPPEATDSAAIPSEDLGETFGRVRALSMTLAHPAIYRAEDGFTEDGRTYLVYRDEPLTPLAGRAERMSESEALSVAIQLCQVVAFIHRRGLRVNDLCPESIAFDREGRVKLTSLDYVSNDDELQGEPIFNDGYTAPELYKSKQADKRADVFSLGALLYTCLTGERLAAESWREEAGEVRFYPPYVVTPALENAIRRALSFDPQSRWPNVDAFKAELLKISGTFEIRAAALTDVGKVRELNEDAVLIAEYRRESQIEPAIGLLYVIADGMGGAEAGEVASAIAVATIRDYAETHLRDAATAGLSTLMQDALEEANRKILAFQTDHPEARGMGSTAVAVVIVPPDAAIGWVGDSRIYLIETRGVRQLSKDHSLVQRLVEIGQITAEEARHHEHKNVITRSLGARPKGPAGVEAMALRLKREDRLLLCSDGLTAHVSDPQIGEIIRRHREPGAAARELIAAALAGGGTDNVSVVVLYAD
jgi:protein phosphatase